ncbi:MAG: outer membrane beta-barrel protein [Candidatus Zixiibacteriota bacterium]
MKKLVMVGLALALLSLPVVASADDSSEKDVLEVGLGGGFSVPAGGATNWNDSLGAKSGWALGGEIGYFLNANLTLGFSAKYSQFGRKETAIDPKQHHRVYNPALFLKYHFWGNSSFVPYVSGNFGLMFPKFSRIVVDNGASKYRELGYRPGLAAGVGAGVFYYTTDYSGLFIEADYTMGFTKKVTKAYQDQKYSFGKNISVMNVRAGIEVFFGSK